MTRGQKLAEHTESDRPDHEQAKAVIRDVLRRTDGPYDAVPSKELAARTPVSASTVRDLIQELRREAHVPVVAGANGYYRITDVDELRRQLQRIDDEIETRERTKEELTRAWNRE